MNHNQPDPAAPAASMSKSKQRGMRIAQAAWVLVAAAAVVILAGSLKGYGTWLRGLMPSSPSSEKYSVFNVLSGLTSLTTALICLFLGLILFRQKRHEPMALFVSFYVMIYGIVFAGPLENLYPLFPGASDLAISVVQPMLLTATVPLMLLLPDGRFVPSWTRWLIPVSLTTLIFLPFIDAKSISKGNTLPVQFLAAMWLILFTVAFAAQVYRYRRISTSVQREQTRWVVFGLIAWISLLALQSIPFFYLQNLPPGASQPGWAAASGSLWWLAMSTIPVTLTIATLRYRLYNIDLIINRTLVYGALTAILAGMYSASISLFQRLFVAMTGSKSDAAIVVTTLILASTFTPIKTRLQTIVDRRFKDVHEPIRRLKDFSDQVNGGIWIIDRKLALKRLLEEAANAFGANSGVATWIEGGDELTIATHGDWRGDSRITVPLMRNSRLLGKISLGARKNGAGYEPEDARSLEAAAETVARALALTVDPPAG